MGVNTDLKLIAVNVNSIIANSKRYSLLKFIEEHTPDIVLLSETKLNHKHRITFEQYQCIRTDRPNSTQGGGTAILIKNEIAYKPITFTQLPNLNSLESTAIQLTFTNNTKLTIISVYAAGHYNISFTTEINHLFSQNNILADNSFFIIAGDLNARHPDWGDSTINSRGGYLKNWLSSNAIEYRINLFAPCQATYPKADSYLDLCLADARLDFHNTPSNKLSTLEYDSDHRAIAFSINLKSINSQIPITSINNTPFNYKKTNWEKFNNKFSNLSSYLDIPCNRNLSNQEIDIYVDQLESCILNTIDKTVPKFKQSNSVAKYVNNKSESLHRKKWLLSLT